MKNFFILFIVLSVASFFTACTTSPKVVDFTSGQRGDSKKETWSTQQTSSKTINFTR